MTRVYGIRHHGPGSSKNLLHALQQQQPDIILIEGPPDAQKVLAHAADKDMKPPVALLIYDAKDLNRAHYYPFASFSPEWQAVLYAYKKAIPVLFIDLPASMQLSSETSNEIPLTIEESAGQKAIRYDPLGYLAKLAGYTDGEKWWESTFEKWEASEEVFPMIAELMKQLREEAKEQRPETLMREAHMRKMIRKAIKDGHENIAVVCGAWHVPALQAYDNIPAKADISLLRGGSKVKTEAVWVPWSYRQMLPSEGYGAGVDSPAWYALLFKKRGETAMRWMTKAARLLRKKDINVSSAHVLEATRLAHTLAAMRQQPSPGLNELRDAALSVLCAGSETMLKLIHDKLVAGDEVGKLSKSSPKTSLQKDLEKRIRSARLGKYWESEETTHKELDLRKPTHLATSQLLSMMQLLDMPFGKQLANSRLRKGSFKEKWKLSWKPSFSVQTVRASQWGSDLDSAATYRLKQDAANTQRLSEFIELLDLSLRSGLTSSLPVLMRRLQVLMAQTEDTWQLLQVFPPLVKAMRYGSIRDTDQSVLLNILEELVPRVFVGLPQACRKLEFDVAAAHLQDILSAHHYLQLLEDDSYAKGWIQALRRSNEFSDVSAIISGGITRLLFDLGEYSLVHTSERLSFALSLRTEALQAAEWLQGFIQESGLLLLYHTELWQILNEWVNTLDSERFEELLPLLRRAFSEIPAPERNRLFSLVKGSDKPIVSPEQQSAITLDSELWQPLISQVDKLLGEQQQKT